MTYKLEAIMGCIKSPVELTLPGGEELRYDDGTQALQADFKQRLKIQSIEARDGVVQVILEEVESLPTNWAGDEPVSFF